jgi:hypothetical protein
MWLKLPKSLNLSQIKTVHKVFHLGPIFKRHSFFRNTLINKKNSHAHFMSKNQPLMPTIFAFLKFPGIQPAHLQTLTFITRSKHLI